jgi:hypothetical protein
MSSNVRLRQSRVSEAESFVDQVNRVGEETVGDAPCGGTRSCSRRRVGTGGDGVFHWMLWKVVSRLTLSEGEGNVESIHSKIG